MVQGKLLKRRISRRQVLKGAALLNQPGPTSFLRGAAEAAEVNIGVIYPTSGRWPVSARPASTPQNWRPTTSMPREESSPSKERNSTYHHGLPE